MKTKFIYLSILLIYLVGCIHDQSNYDFKDLNSIRIDSIRGTYILDKFDTLMITPVITFAQQPTEISWEWKINDKIISTDSVLRYRVEQTYGNHVIVCCVTEKGSELKYYETSDLVVNPPFGYGTYVLSEEQEDKRAILSFFKQEWVDDPTLTFYVDVVPNLGFNPTKLIRTERTMEPEAVYVVCKDGDAKVSILDFHTLEPIRYANEQNMSGAFNGSFAPTYMKKNLVGGVISDGKLFTYDFISSKTLYAPALGDYYLADWLASDVAWENYFFVGYDQQNYRFIVLQSNETKNNFIYDNIYNIAEVCNDGIPLFNGQQFLAGAIAIQEKYAYNEHKLILYNTSERKAYFYDLTINASENMGMVTPVIQFNQTSIQEKYISDQSLCLFNKSASTWYVSDGKTIYGLFYKGGEPEKIFTIPKGEITALGFPGANDNTIAVGVYDSDSNDEIKGSIYLIDVKNQDYKVTAYTNKIKGKPLEITW